MGCLFFLQYFMSIFKIVCHFSCSVRSQYLGSDITR